MSFTEILPAGLSAEDAFAILAFTAALLGMLAVWYGLIAKNPMRIRARALANRRAGLKSGLMGPKRRQKPEQAMTLMRSVIGRLYSVRGNFAAEAEKSLTKAGWRSNDALVAYIFVKATLPVLLLVAAAIAMFPLALGEMQPMVRLLIVVASTTAGLFMPDWFVRFRAGKRRKSMQRALPDSLDLLVICVEAGLGLDAALVRVSREMGSASPEFAEELNLTAMELGFLPERRSALDNLLERTQLPALRGVVNTLVQTEKYGTPLANSLRVLSAEFRDERMLKAEEKAAKLPATLTVPMIVFILPTLFIVLLGPAAFRAIDALSGF
ncbi:MAG: type II secretion system F family protein [Rhodospirillales bacterium]|nr:type II secretion system F family protein [Rhodospirillales bacterium]